MTIDEAMTDLSIQREVKRQLGKSLQAEALSLGIEALKREERNRKDPNYVLVGPLPGETEELNHKGLPLGGTTVQYK